MPWARQPARKPAETHFRPDGQEGSVSQKEGTWNNKRSGPDEGFALSDASLYFGYLASFSLYQPMILVFRNSPTRAAMSQ